MGFKISCKPPSWPLGKYWSLFVWVLMIFTIFCCLLCRKLKKKFLLASISHLLILKIFQVTLFRKLAPAFRKPPVCGDLASTSTLTPRPAARWGSWYPPSTFCSRPMITNGLWRMQSSALSTVYWSSLVSKYSTVCIHIPHIHLTCNQDLLSNLQLQLRLWLWLRIKRWKSLYSCVLLISSQFALVKVLACYWIITK